MKAFLLAAGFGTRLQPLTLERPKPMIPLLNRPLIGWIVDHAMQAGVREFLVNLHYLPEAIESYLPEAFPSATFTFSHETEILGTGGALRKMRPILEADEDFFLANGDTIQRPPFAALRAARREHDALAALTLRHPPEGDKYTAVWLEGGLITGFGSGTGEPLMFSGSHCISRRALELLPDKPFSGIVEDVYRVTREPLAGLVVDDPFWFDIGTPQRYLGATRALLGNDTLRDPTAEVRGRIVRTVVGARSIVDGTLTGSIVWEDCRIGANVRLANCIVGHGVELAEGEFANTIICKGERDLVFASF